jgi:hypothetical protein
MDASFMTPLGIGWKEIQIHYFMIFARQVSPFSAEVGNTDGIVG